MTENDDRTLAHRFAELRDRDRKTAPQFDAVAGAAQAHVPVLRLRRGRLLMAAAAAAALFLSVSLLTRRPLSTDSLAAWQPASDELLAQAMASLVTGFPALHESVLDSFIPRP